MRRRCARCITQESRGAIRSRVLFHRRIPTAVNQATCHLPEYVMYRINIRAGAHTRASTRMNTRGREKECEIFSATLKTGVACPRDTNPPLVLSSSLSLQFDPARKPQSLIFPYIYSIRDGWNVNSFVRTPDGMSVHFFFFLFVTLTVYACHGIGRNKIFWYFPGKVRLKLCTYPYPVRCWL